MPVDAEGDLVQGRQRAGGPGRLDQLLLGRRTGCARMEVGDAEALAEPGERHHPSLRPGRETKAAALGDRAGATDQRQVRAALPGGDQVGIAIGDQGLGACQAGQVAARRDEVRVGVAGGGEALRPARRAFLEQRDVPGRVREHRLERGKQIDVDLRVGRPALGRPEQPGAPREELRLGRMVAAVEQVPAQRANLHRRRLSARPRRHAPFGLG